MLRPGFAESGGYVPPWVDVEFKDEVLDDEVQRFVASANGVGGEAGEALTLELHALGVVGAEYVFAQRADAVDSLKPRRTHVVRLGLRHPWTGEREWPSAEEVQRIVDRLRSDPRVRASAPGTTFQPASIMPSLLGSGKCIDKKSPLENQWYIFRCNVDQVWATGNVGTGVSVADLDWGFKVDHPDLSLNSGRAASFVANYLGVENGTFLEHGTGVCGFIAARNDGIGVVGIAHGADVWPIQAAVRLSPRDVGTENGWVAALDTLASGSGSSKPSVILVEAEVGSSECIEAALDVNAAIRRAIGAGIVVCIPAGNGDQSIDAPETVIPRTNAVIVAATAHDYALNCQSNPRWWDAAGVASNYGTRVTVCAPGDSHHDVTCNSPRGYRIDFGGTSGAAAKVVGVIALMLRARSRSHQDVLDAFAKSGPSVGGSTEPMGPFLDAHALV